MKEPDRKRGGTFLRDANGKLLQHIPPTRVALGEAPSPKTPSEPAAQAEKSVIDTPRTQRGSKE